MEDKLENLFEQIKNIRIIGERLSGEPEILHEIEDYFRNVEFYPTIRDQIRKVLEYVPSIFPEDWKSPGGFDELNFKQQEAYKDIARSGITICRGPIIQRIIELAVEYRDRESF